MKVIIFVAVACAAALSLAGCVMQKTGMINDATGQTVACNNVGVGDIGVIVSLAMHHACVKNAEAAGYHVIGEAAPLPGAAPPAPAASYIPGVQS